MSDRDWNMTITMKENDKRGNDKAPDYLGSFTMDNKQYNFSLWPAKSGNGFSGNIQERQHNRGTNNYVPKATSDVSGLDDDLPPF